MAQDSSGGNKPFDPLEPWRGVRDVYMDAWAKSMVEMVNSEGYAQATGAMLDNYLTFSAPFREALEKTMLKTLEQLAMPSRADVISIAERMTSIEMRLDDMEVKLDSIEQLLVRAAAPAAPQVVRAAQPSNQKARSKAKATKGKSPKAKRGRK